MKKRLTEIADDFGISFDEAIDIAFKNLAEDMLSGKGKNTWITGRGPNGYGFHSPYTRHLQGQGHPSLS